MKLPLALKSVMLFQRGVTAGNFQNLEMALTGFPNSDLSDMEAALKFESHRRIICGLAIYQLINKLISTKP